MSLPDESVSISTFIAALLLAACSSSDGTEFTGATGAGAGGPGSGGDFIGLGDGAGASGTASGGSARTSTGAGGSAGSATCSGAGCGTPHAGALPAGSTCAARNDCASGRCEPTTGVTGEVCLGACFADGAPCTHALDCCSTGCHSGKCGGQCTVIGDDCKQNSDCCSDICRGGRCDVDLANADCRPTGEDCTSGHSRGCCNECDDRTKRCAFGKDTCFAQGVACAADSDCCRGVCTAGKCTTPCQPNGSACTSATDCCSALCSAAGLCADKQAPDGGTSSCVPTEGQCTADAQCCTGTCFGGFCEAVIR